MNLKQLLENTAGEVPQKTALVMGSQRITYGELDQSANRVANALISLGMKKGDHVALLMSHCPYWVASFFGIIKAGGVAVLLSHMLKAPEHDALLRDSDAKYFITEDKFTQMLAGFLPDIPLLKEVLITDSNEYRELIAKSSPVAPDVDINDSDVAMIFYTSGVLGKQKGVVHTHASLEAAHKFVSSGIKRTRDDVVIDTPPFYYLFGLSEVLFGNILEGSTTVLIPAFTPRTVLQAIQDEKATIIFGVPAILNSLAMLREEVIAKYDVSSLRVASTAGAKSVVHVMKTLENKFGLRLCESYGMSELTVVCLSTLDDGKVGTVGKPVCEMKIVDDNGNEVPQGEIGEALFRSPSQMKEYYKAPDLTAEVTRGGWFHSGDLVRMDEDGYIEYIEKKSFIIVTPTGLKIAPTEVEEVLLRYPGVAEAAYVGVIDGHGPNRLIPTAFIAVEKDKTLTTEELFDYCRHNLADFKLPRKFKFIDTLPKVGSGKINRQKLKQGDI